MPLLLVILISISFCSAQSRQAPKRTAPGRDRAPFLEQAKLFEETSSAPYAAKLVLRNGLTILVEEYRSQPVMSIQTHVQAGTFNEPAESIGAARLLASMIYRGPADKEAGTYRQSVQALGGVISKSVDYDETVFEMIVPSSQWKKALELQSSALMNASLNSDDLALEAGLLVNEVRDRLDNPDIFAEEKLLELAFNQPRMGKLDELSGGRLPALKKENLSDFQKVMFVPAKTAISISGDINANEVLNELARIYGKSAASAVKSVSTPVDKSQNGFRYQLVKGNVAVPHVLYGFHTAEENAEDFRALEILRAILGLGEGSILNSRLRDQKGLISKEDTTLLANRNFGYLLIQTEVDAQDIDKCQIAVLTEIELLKRHEPSETDMARALAQLELAYWEGLESTAGRASAIAEADSLGDWKRSSRYLAELKKVKPADIKRVANKYLRLENCSILEYLPATDNQ